MTQILLANIGAATLLFLGVITLVVVLDRLWQRKAWRMFCQTFRALTYGKRKSSKQYSLLAINGYIYGWAAHLLIRFKAVDK